MTDRHVSVTAIVAIAVVAMFLGAVVFNRNMELQADKKGMQLRLEKPQNDGKLMRAD